MGTNHSCTTHACTHARTCTHTYTHIQKQTYPQTPQGNSNYVLNTILQIIYKGKFEIIFYNKNTKNSHFILLFYFILVENLIPQLSTKTKKPSKHYFALKTV